MKKLAVILILLVVFISLAYVKESLSAALEMKLGHFAADSHPGNLACKMFAEAVEKRTNGQIKVVIYPIEIRISNAIVRVKKGAAQIAGCIRARETERKLGGRFRLPVHLSIRPEYPDARWPRCS